MYSTANKISLDLCAGIPAWNRPLVLYLQLASIVDGEIQMQNSGSIGLYCQVTINDDSWGHQICRLQSRAMLRSGHFSSQLRSSSIAKRWVSVAAHKHTILYYHNSGFISRQISCWRLVNVLKS